MGRVIQTIAFGKRCGNVYGLHRAKAMLPFLTVLAVLITCLSHIYYVDGVRGTDQYSVSGGRLHAGRWSAAVDQYRISGDLLRSGESDKATFFAHNGPLLHIVAFFARLTDPLTAWKYTNLVFFLLAAMLTGMTVRYLSSTTLGYVSTIAFLATPVNVWLASNFLQETFFSSGRTDSVHLCHGRRQCREANFASDCLGSGFVVAPIVPHCGNGLCALSGGGPASLADAHTGCCHNRVGQRPQGSLVPDLVSTNHQEPDCGIGSERS